MIKFFQSSIVRLLNMLILSVITLGLLLFSVIIGLHNYQQITTDLDTKAKGISSIAAIALQEPIWNYDEQAMIGIVKAILLDKDVVGIEVRSSESADPIKTELNSIFNGMTFADITTRKNELRVLVNQATIEKESKVIGKVSIITSQAKALQQITLTSQLIAGFAAALVLVMGFLVWVSARKFVAKPLKGLEISADQLAHGNLDYPIDTGRHDEIGALANSFSDMRDSIKRKIDDLHVLNTTGEVLAGIHDQTLALETVLKVMQKQTNLQEGSIYLVKADELIISAYHPEKKDHASSSSSSPKSFKLGEGIAGQAARLAKILFIPDTSLASEYIDADSADKAKALLCVPMMDDQTVFGVMNFSGDVGSVKFRPEDEGFALTLARLTVVTTKNIQMLNVIEEQNRTLEQKVLERTAQLRQKTNDINSMLQNMQQGIFTVVQGGLVHPEYSAYLERILESGEIAGTYFMNVLLAHADIGSDQLSQIETAVTALLGEDAMMYDFNSHLLIGEFNMQLPDGRRKILEIDWAPIINDEDKIEKLMITVRDITELRGLQQEAESQRQELEIIGQILSVNQEKFKDFVKSSQTFIAENEHLIQVTQLKDIDVLATLFRNMHTIKGNARTYGFKYLTDAVHEAEHTYADMRHHQETQWDKTLLLHELQKAGDYVEKYKSVYESKLSNFTESTPGKFVEAALLEKIETTLAEAMISESVNLTALLTKIDTLFKAIDTEPIPHVLDGILKTLPTLALELGKTPPRTLIQDGGIRVTAEIAPVIKDIFVHAFRNAMDHGLETEEERRVSGKTIQGTIYLQTELDGGDLVFHFRDDGRGLALARIRLKALENGLLSAGDYLDDATAAELIFHSGLSTAQAVSDVSGRGVGMDAVRRFLAKHGGRIAVKFTDVESAGCHFRPFELEIRLPGRFAIQI